MVIVSDQKIIEHQIKDDEHNRIREVLVFTDQAMVKRTVEAQAYEGLNRYLIEINPFYLDKDSVQAGVSGFGEILTVQYRKFPLIQAVQQEVQECTTKKRQLERDKKALQRELEAIHKQQKFIDSTIGFAEVEIPKELKTAFPSPSDLQDMLRFLQQNYTQYNLTETELEKQLEEIEDEINLNQQKIRGLKKPAQAEQKTIEILFMSDREQKIKIEVEYIVKQAGWKPVYKVDVNNELSQTDLTLFAQIHQRTGEAWDDIGISVSNAVPLKGGKLPELSSWNLHLSSTQYVPEPYALGADGGEIMAGAVPAAAEAVLEDLGEPEEAPQADFSQAKVTELPLAYEYSLPQSVSIGQGAEGTLFPLSIEQIAGDFYYYCVPKKDPLVYLVCEALLQNTLLEGQLNVYFSGRYVASTYLSEKRPGQKLLINLGADPNIKVAHEKITDKITDSFFGVVDRLSAAREFEYLITIDNQKDKFIKLNLIDSIPVSTSDRILVKEIKFDPEPSLNNYQECDGVMLWNKVIQAKSSTFIKVQFFIKHPRDDPPYEI